MERILTDPARIDEERSRYHLHVGVTDVGFEEPGGVGSTTVSGSVPRVPREEGAEQKPSTSSRAIARRPVSPWLEATEVLKARTKRGTPSGETLQQEGAIDCVELPRSENRPPQTQVPLTPMCCIGSVIPTSSARSALRAAVTWKMALRQAGASSKAVRRNADTWCTVSARCRPIWPP